MSTAFPSFRLPSFQQESDPVLRPPSNKPSEKDDCCLARIEDIVLPIIASLVGFVFLPVQLAVAITCVVTVGSILYYNDCLDSSDEPPGSKKDVKTPRVTELFTRMFSSRSEGVSSRESEGVEASDVLREFEILDQDDEASVENASRPEVPRTQSRVLDYSDEDEEEFDAITSSSSSQDASLEVAENESQKVMPDDKSQRSLPSEVSVESPNQYIQVGGFSGSLPTLSRAPTDVESKKVVSPKNNRTLGGFSLPLPTLSKTPLDLESKRSLSPKNNNGEEADLSALLEEEEIRSVVGRALNSLGGSVSDGELSDCSVDAADDEAGQGDAAVQPQSAPASLVKPQLTVDISLSAGKSSAAVPVSPIDSHRGSSIGPEFSRAYAFGNSRIIHTVFPDPEQ